MRAEASNDSHFSNRRNLRATRYFSAPLLSVAILAAFSSVAVSQIRLTLKDKFIEDHKNRVGIETTVLVDHSHKSPKTPSPSKPSNDGDIHASVRSNDIGLPAVAEIVNAKDAKDQIRVFVDAAGTNSRIRVSGAWRLWCEHGGIGDQVQGDPLEPAEDTNPDHCFEIHPLTEVAGTDIRHTWKPIDGFKNKDAEDAFSRYELIKSEIEHNAQRRRTTIHTNGLGFNYVEFVIELREDPTFTVDDGLIVRCDVLTVDGEMLVKNRRMIFAKGTKPHDEVLRLRRGQRMRVLGMPRVNLALISWRVRNSAGRPEVLRWNLPYEMIIVGFFESVPVDDND
jgi:hypothetical protein